MTSTQGTTGWSSLSQLGQAGVIGQIGGIATGLIGAYFASSTAKYQSKMSALRFEHKRDMALFNASMKETQAQHINRVENQRFRDKTLGFGKAKGTSRALMAARGVQMGVGSTKDAFVSDEILKELDKITMNSNKVRAVSNKRLEAVGLGIQADAHGLSASNAWDTASSISPWMNMSSSLLTGTNNLISSLPTSFWQK